MAIGKRKERSLVRKRKDLLKMEYEDKNKQKGINKIDIKIKKK